MCHSVYCWKHCRVQMMGISEEETWPQHCLRNRSHSKYKFANSHWSVSAQYEHETWSCLIVGHSRNINIPVICWEATKQHSHMALVRRIMLFKAHFCACLLLSFSNFIIFHYFFYWRCFMINLVDLKVSLIIWMCYNFCND